VTSPRRFPWRKPPENVQWADLVRECGEKLTDPVLWEKFTLRFEKPLLSFLTRAVHQTARNVPTNPDEDIHELVHDMAQEVYVRLVENKGRLLRSFRGETEFAVLSFLASISINVSRDRIRRLRAQRRIQEVVPIEETEDVDLQPASPGTMDLGAMLKWSDVERLIQAESDPTTAARNVLICKLHYVEGLTVEEIAQYPGFKLNASGIETILRRMKARLQRRANEI
jgi:RNA polymerase sigma factor (sigma-70 family)